MALSVARIQELIEKQGKIWSDAEAYYRSGLITEAQKLKLQSNAHKEAERLRKSLGYSGGADGSQVILVDEKIFTSSQNKIYESEVRDKPFKNSDYPAYYGGDSQEDIEKEKQAIIAETAGVSGVSSGMSPVVIPLLIVGAIVLLLK